LIIDVARLNPTTAVVLEGGSAITMERWAGVVPAILMAWYPGQEGGTAIAEVLFGEVNPSGRLPITFPRAEADLPVFDNHAREVVYAYDHGYRHVDRHGIEPRFPFGFGLSYTTYRYDSVTVSNSVLAPGGVQRVSVRVRNTAGRAGTETVQLYLSTEGSAVERPLRALAGFAQVHLEAGEARAVVIELPAEGLAYYDVAAGGWHIEPGSYTVHAGPHSRDLPLRTSFRVVAN
jgi:beta-glucosidase